MRGRPRPARTVWPEQAGRQASVPAVWVPHLAIQAERRMFWPGRLAAQQVVQPAELDRRRSAATRVLEYPGRVEVRWSRAAGRRQGSELPASRRSPRSRAAPVWRAAERRTEGKTSTLQRLSRCISDKTP